MSSWCIYIYISQSYKSYHILYIIYYIQYTYWHLLYAYWFRFSNVFLYLDIRFFQKPIFIKKSSLKCPSFSWLTNHVIFICTCNRPQNCTDHQVISPFLSRSLGWFLARQKTGKRPVLPFCSKGKILGSSRKLQGNLDPKKQITRQIYTSELLTTGTQVPPDPAKMVMYIIPSNWKNASWWENPFWGSWLYQEVWVSNVVWIDFPLMSTNLVLDSSLFSKLSCKNCQDKRKKTLSIKEPYWTVVENPTGVVGCVIVEIST